MKTSRRSFLITSVAAVSAVALSSREALAADLPMLAESDPTAQALGYKADATKVDKAKYAKYAAGQDCAACMLYQGKPGSASGPCGAFPGKQVSAKGWCSAFSKKA
ncbi:High potential iron-sulfur protein [Burkholderia pyrrocinia]|uniref:high-potential iron-sulfur protein n=1 Tax=Burkholderia stagnalis TaxID=1503054 RepID=UPI000304285D|nr:high-potential iron-sulfur protein [Burkholderia stagnalis]KVN36287.1 High potential iron-sulfur protein [Burkholderia pyrrocinia]WGS41780.1 high-potential iron-sulfur protein [Burkholderia sp. JSH-S8]